MQHLEPQKIDFEQVKDCILNHTYENDDIFINNANNNGVNLLPAINESILKDLDIFWSKEEAKLITNFKNLWYWIKIFNLSICKVLVILFIK